MGALLAESNHPVRLGKECMVLATAHVLARVKLGTPLSDDNVSGLHFLPTEQLDAQAFRYGVATIIGTTACLLCAIVHSWSRVSLAFNTSDFHFGEALAVALSFLKMLTSVEFNDLYLPAAALFQYFSSHLPTFNVRRTNFDRFPSPDH